MPGHPASGGARLLIVDQPLLWHRVVIDATEADEAVVEALRAVTHGAEPALRPVAEAHLAVQRSADGHVVLDRGDLLVRAATPRQVLDAVFARVHRRAFELAARRGWVRVHGALLGVEGARVVVVGSPGAGKTTLAVEALAAGHAAEADESVLVRDGVVVAVPRRFHVKPGTEVVVPTAAPWLAAAPRLDGDPPLRLLDPTEAGLAWRLPVGPVDHVVVCHRAGEAGLARESATALMPEVLVQTFPTVESRATVVREVASLLRGVGTHRLAIADGPGALEALSVVARAGRAG